MKHSIALVTGATSGLGHAAARLLAAEGYREVIVTGRSLARIQETAAQLAAETKTADLHAAGAGSGRRRPAFSPPSPRSSSEVGRSISYCSMPDWSQPRSA